MPIYDVNGSRLYSCCDVDGEDVTKAYDVDGEEVFTKSLKVMTYNVRWFQDFNSQQTMQDIIINGNDADIIGFQEISKNGSIPSLGQTLLTNWQYKQLSNHVNYIALVSKLPMSNIVIADFTTQDPYDISVYNETRAYMMCDIVVDGKTVRWINTHLCVMDDGTYRTAQIMEIYALAEQAERCIITGDFNFNKFSESDPLWISMYKPFADAGYNFANCTTARGFTKTHTESATATSLAEMTTPPDNIITSGNISITSVKFDTTKFSYLNGQMIDHIPIICELEVN